MRTGKTPFFTRTISIWREVPENVLFDMIMEVARPLHGRSTNMVLLETAILAGLGLLNLCAIGFLAHWIRMHLDQGLQDIDEKLAIAITALIDKLMSGNLGEFEPPNPIQGAIAQLIQGMAHQKMNTINATVSERGTDGQFVPPQSFE